MFIWDPGRVSVRIRAIVGGFVLQSFLAVSYAATFHVAPCGDDAWTGFGETCEAPGGPERTIQAAINAAADGDEIILLDGIYIGPGNRQISSGKTITLRSQNGPADCIVELENNQLGFSNLFGRFTLDGLTVRNSGGSGVVCGENVTVKNCVISGNKDGGIRTFNGNPLISGCTITGNVKGGIRLEGSGAPKIADCLIRGNSADTGGGILIGTNAVSIFNCTIQNNLATGPLTGGLGGGIYITSAGKATIWNCIFQNNLALNDGGAVYDAGQSGSLFINNTIVGNTAVFFGGGVVRNATGTLFVRNCIFWNDAAGIGAELATITAGEIRAAYCVVAGGTAGIFGTVRLGLGIVTSDPRFVDPADGNFRLKAGSPCIDAGDNFSVPAAVKTDFANKLRFVDDMRTADTGLGAAPLVDLGAFEFPAQAAKKGYAGPP